MTDLRGSLGNLRETVGAEVFDTVLTQVYAEHAEERGIAPGLLKEEMKARCGWNPGQMRSRCLLLRESGTEGLPADDFWSQVAVMDLEEKMLARMWEAFPDAREKIMRRYFESQLNAPEVFGFVEADHGVAPHPTVAANLPPSAGRAPAYAPNTKGIAQQVPNHILAQRSRLEEDLHAGRRNDRGPSQSLEGQSFAPRSNANAVRAQRAQMAEMMQSQNALGKDGKVTRPYMGIYLFGKTDDFGHDIEIGLGQHDGGKMPMDPRVAFWLANRLEEKLGEKGVTSPTGKTPLVHVVTFAPKFRGRPSVTRMRYGDEIDGFQGFGEDFQGVSLELGEALRKQYGDQVVLVWEEVLKEFSTQFPNMEAFESFNENQDRYDQALAAERADFLNIEKHVQFRPDVRADEIQMTEGARDQLGFKRGDEVSVDGLSGKFKVVRMAAEHVKGERWIALSLTHQSNLSESLSIQKIEQSA